MAVSMNGEWAGAISPDGWVQLWRLEDGERVQAVGLDESPSSLAFAPDDRILLIGTEEGAVLTLDSEGVRGELSRFDEAVKAIATAGDRLGIALSGGDVVILDADSGREVLRLERAGPELTAMSLDSDGGSLAVGDETGSVVVYSTKTGELVELLPRHSGRITAIFFDRVQRRFVSASRNGTLVADGKGGPSVYRGHSGPISGACINAAGTRYLSASMDRTLRVWDARSPADSTRLDTRGARLVGGSFSPNGSTLLLGAVEGYVLRFDATSARLTAAWHSGHVSDLAFAADGRGWVSTLDGHLVVVEADDSLAVLGSHGSGSTSDLCVVAAGERAVSGSRDGTIRVWNTTDRALEREIASDAGPVLALSLDASGDRLASVHADGSASLWRLADGTHSVLEEPSERGSRVVAFQPTGAAVAIGDSSGRVVIHTLGGEQERVLRSGEAGISALAWTPDASRLVAASEDGSLRIWHAELEDPLWTERREGGEIRDLAFDPSGSRLLVVWSETDASILETGGALERLEEHEAEIAVRSRAEATIEPLVREGSIDRARVQSALEEAALDEREAKLARALANERAWRAERLRRSAWEVLVRSDAPVAEHQEALQFASEAEKLLGKDPWIRTAVSAGLLRKGSFEQALQILQECVLELRGDQQASARALLGITLCRLNYRQEARDLRNQLPEGSHGVPELPLAHELQACLEQPDEEP
jgi:WD40 repeat protein